MNNSQASIDIGAVLDEGPFSRLQLIVVAMAAFAIVMDGFDGQLIGFAIPLIIKEWGITRDAFAAAVAAGLLGMAVGSTCAGLFADRVGRRLALGACVTLFGAATCAIGFAPDVFTIAALRFIAGLGIGGALPSASTMTAEFTPARRRTLAVAVTIVCYPMGGILAGLFAGAVLPSYGWRGLFWMGGLLPIALGLILMTTLPESPRFLARHPKAWPRLVQLLARMGRSVPTGSRFIDAAEAQAQHQPRRGLAELFKAGMGRETLALSAAFFMCTLAIYSAFSWLPSMLSASGLPLSMAGSGLTAYNFGGVLGALACAAAITRFGSRTALLVCSAGGAVSALVMQGLDLSTSATWLIPGLAIHGLFVNAVQVSLYALCAHVYPTEIRATGTAVTLSLGRFGAILSSFAGAAVITHGGPSAYLTMLGSAMACVLVALLFSRRHIPGRAGKPMPGLGVASS